MSEWREPWEEVDPNWFDHYPDDNIHVPDETHCARGRHCIGWQDVPRSRQGGWAAPVGIYLYDPDGYSERAVWGSCWAPVTEPHLWYCEDCWDDITNFELHCYEPILSGDDGGIFWDVHVNDDHTYLVVLSTVTRTHATSWEREIDQTFYTLNRARVWAETEVQRMIADELESEHRAGLHRKEEDGRAVASDDRPEGDGGQGL